MTAPMRNTAATPESNDGAAVPAVGPAAGTGKASYMRPLGATPLDDDGVICPCHNSPSACEYCRPGIDAMVERIHAAFYAHVRAEDEQAERVERFRLAEGEEVWQLGDYSDDADDEPTEDDRDWTPYCTGCGSMTYRGCHCGPIAENN